LTCQLFSSSPSSSPVVQYCCDCLRFVGARPCLVGIALRQGRFCSGPARGLTRRVPTRGGVQIAASLSKFVAGERRRLHNQPSWTCSDPN
jgi:hypothetical protein